MGRPRRAPSMASPLRGNPHFVCLLLVLLLAPPAAALLNITSLVGIELPDYLSFNAAVTATHRVDCHRPSSDGATEEDAAFPLSVAPGSALKLHLRHRSAAPSGGALARRPLKETVEESNHHDLHRIQALHRRITERKNQKAEDRLSSPRPHHRHRHRHHDKRHYRPMGPAGTEAPSLAGQLTAPLKSGVALGSGEYLVDMLVGTPPRHFSVIMDTGSDLNWLQCQPCRDCFEQSGPVFDPALSSSYRPVPCADSRCKLVSSPDPPPPCSSSAAACPYFYWYGDRSNTTGDLALETFTVDLIGTGGTDQQQHRMDSVIFGCGHWNRGLFHGAAGLLGLGRGPLSFSSQLRSGGRGGAGVFSYCLVGRNSDLSVSGKLVLGEDPAVMAHPHLNFTSFVAGKDNPADTFYYVHVKGVRVGGRLLDIPKEVWELTPDGAGGTIVDSGTTLSYFAEPAYRAIREAVLREVKGYPVLEDFPVLSPCYNVSGVAKLELPGIAVVFADGAVWEFPPENSFIRLEPEEVACLAVLGTPRSSLSILGNYQQQNFHVVYDAGRSRLGFAPALCAEA